MRKGRDGAGTSTISEHHVKNQVTCDNQWYLRQNYVPFRRIGGSVSLRLQRIVQKYLVFHLVLEGIPIPSLAVFNFPIRRCHRVGLSMKLFRLKASILCFFCSLLKAEFVLLRCFATVSRKKCHIVPN